MHLKEKDRQLAFSILLPPILSWRFTVMAQLNHLLHTVPPWFNCYRHLKTRTLFEHLIYWLSRYYQCFGFFCKDCTNAHVVCFSAGRCQQALHFLFSYFPLISCPLSVCFPICSLTAKIASTSNLRQNAFSIMNYARCWMRTKMFECFCLLVTFCSLLCILIWSTVKSQTPLFALARYDACTAWTLCCCLWKCSSIIAPIRD